MEGVGWGSEVEFDELVANRRRRQHAEVCEQQRDVGRRGVVHQRVGAVRRLAAVLPRENNNAIHCSGPLSVCLRMPVKASRVGAHVPLRVRAYSFHGTRVFLSGYARVPFRVRACSFQGTRVFLSEYARSSQGTRVFFSGYARVPLRVRACSFMLLSPSLPPTRSSTGTYRKVGSGGCRKVAPRVHTCRHVSSISGLNACSTAHLGRVGHVLLVKRVKTHELEAFCDNVERFVHGFGHDRDLVRAYLKDSKQIHHMELCQARTPLTYRREGRVGGSNGRGRGW